MQRGSDNIDYKLTRRSFKIQGVTSNVVSVGGKKVGVVKIKSFSACTSEEVQKALTQFPKVDLLALDLRDNVGGLLPGGIDTARLFLPRDRSIVTVTNYKGTVDTQSTYADGMDTTTPMMLLVNGKTASAAEVLTAALVDNERSPGSPRIAAKGAWHLGEEGTAWRRRQQMDVSYGSCVRDGTVC